MNPRFFINRPIFAAVLSIFILLVGFIAMRNLAVEQAPNITPPTVEISATYPGASAEEVARAVATPIESRLSGAERMLYYSSSSNSDGSLSITVTFEVGTDIDIATVDLQNRVNRATPQLPQEVTRMGVTVAKKSSSILGVLALKSADPQYDALFLGNYATINFLDSIKRVPGVGDATVFGASDYTMRVLLDPVRMARLGVTPSDVAQVLREQNNSFPAGMLGREPAPARTEYTIPVVTRSRLSEVSQFEELIVRSMPDGATVRLRDVARIELGGQSYSMEGRLNGKPAAIIPIYLAPGANALNTVDAVKKTMDEFSVRFPQGVTYDMPYDTTPFIRVSVQEVLKTLAEAMVLVFLVVYLFLQNWRATLIPMLTVPVSLIGTFAGMYALGFSINTLTLFGMVLAIGIVVDDAIVVLENVERIMTEEKLPPREATKKAMKDITGPVVAIVLVLCAVFVPVGFLGGLSGQLYRQFAITIAMSVVLSGIVALTLCPALCALLLKSDHGPKRGFFGWFNDRFERLTRGYTSGVRKTLRHAGITFTLFLALCAGTYGLFKKVPTGFIPAEDQGSMFVGVMLPDGASKERTTAVLEKVERVLLDQPEIQNAVCLNGMNFLFGTRTANGATLFVRLRPWSERSGPGQDVDSLVARCSREFAAINEALIIAVNPPPIQGLGSSAGFSVQLLNRTGMPLNEFAAKTGAFRAELAKLPELSAASLRTGFSIGAPKVYLNLDRERAKSLGIPVDEVFTTLQAYLGTTYVNDFFKFGRVYKVQLEGEADYRRSTDDFQLLQVRNGSGEMVPLNAVITPDFTTGPDALTHFNGNQTVSLAGAPAPGYSTGEAMAAIEKLANEKLVAEGLDYAWDGVSYQEKRTGSDSAKVFILGLVMVFLLLAAQYESWTIPFAVILSIPIGIFGALLSVFMRDMPNDTYFQIGLLTLVGLAAKNAILIVEFANTRVAAGMPLLDAAAEAARLRLRPIIMTSLAFILGVFPLVIAKGAGAAGRHSIGTGVCGGMLAATFIAIFFIPLFFVLMRRVADRVSALSGPREAASGHDEHGD